jgi:hypothetical protein
MTATKHNDSTGHKRGARGHGKPSKSDLDFMRPDYDKKLYAATDGQREVGACAYTGERYGLQGESGENDE